MERAGSSSSVWYGHQLLIRLPSPARSTWVGLLLGGLLVGCRLGAQAPSPSGSGADAASSDKIPLSFRLELEAAGCGGPHGAVQGSLSADGLVPLGKQGLQAVVGGFSENFRFSGAESGATAPLHAVGAEAGFEVDEDGETVAEALARPGRYDAGGPHPGDLDCPVELWSGFPLPGVKNLEGAAGFENGRFYHHAVPIAGLVWTPDRRFRLEATYPEPAIVYAPRPGLELSAAGELVGDGFLTGMRTPVEYYGYRVGPAVQWRRREWRLRLSAGDEIAQDFDFFRENREVRRGGAPYLAGAVTWRAP